MHAIIPARLAGGLWIEHCLFVIIQMLADNLFFIFNTALRCFSHLCPYTEKRRLASWHSCRIRLNFANCCSWWSWWISRVLDVSKRLQTPPLLRSPTPSFTAFPLRTPQSWPILTLINTSPAGNGNRGFSQRRPPSEPLSGVMREMGASGSCQLRGRGH